MPRRLATILWNRRLGPNAMYVQKGTAIAITDHASMREKKNPPNVEKVESRCEMTMKVGELRLRRSS